jgi:uncharacterized protein (DUF433 family)
MRRNPRKGLPPYAGYGEGPPAEQCGEGYEYWRCLVLHPTAAPDELEYASMSDREEIRVTLSDRIEVNPKVMLGKPVIRGTRIPVELILRKLGEGASEEDLLDAYPHLNVEDIRAAMLYAAEALAHEEIV